MVYHEKKKKNKTKSEQKSQLGSWAPSSPIQNSLSLNEQENSVEIATQGMAVSGPSDEGV